jgi:hypothetical protein
MRNTLPDRAFRLRAIREENIGPPMESSSIVCNAGPLIALALADQLKLLRALYRSILVPEALWREVVDSGFGRVGA